MAHNLSIITSSDSDATAMKTIKSINNGVHQYIQKAAL